LGNLAFIAASILQKLYEKVGEEFGLRIQGLFAHTLISMGVQVLDCKPQGHPDIIADTGTERWKFEVTFVRNFPYKLDTADINSIHPRSEAQRGFLAILDAGPPVRWICLPYEVISKKLGSGLYSTQLLRIADSRFSSECTNSFASLLIRNEYRLNSLSFHLLKQWAMEGKGV